MVNRVGSQQGVPQVKPKISQNSTGCWGGKKISQGSPEGTGRVSGAAKMSIGGVALSLLSATEMLIVGGLEDNYRASGTDNILSEHPVAFFEAGMAGLLVGMGLVVVGGVWTACSSIARMLNIDEKTPLIIKDKAPSGSGDVVNLRAGEKSDGKKYFNQ